MISKYQIWVFFVVLFLYKNLLLEYFFKMLKHIVGRAVYSVFF